MNRKRVQRLVKAHDCCSPCAPRAGWALDDRFRAREAIAVIDAAVAEQEIGAYITRNHHRPRIGLAH